MANVQSIQDKQRRSSMSETEHMENIEHAEEMIRFFNVRITKLEAQIKKLSDEEEDTLYF